ncbi:sulfotransferase domain-containing protein [Alphaproteobacteria bacterium]|nr:sulfotransferase domain-containing protein [Alphaproteobacteria bacterium]
MPTSQPDFIIAGFNRCGTSTLHNLCTLHDGFFMSKPKEIQYFLVNENYKRGHEWYEDHFKGARPDQIKGESTPSYIYKGMVFEKDLFTYGWQPDDDCLMRLKSYNPDIKLIISLRNPIDCAHSNFEKAKTRGAERTNITFEEAIHEELSGKRSPKTTYLCYHYLTQYALHIEHLLSIFPRENVHFLIFENWIKQQQQTIDNICKFLNTNTQKITQDVHANQGLNPKSKMAHKVLNPLLKNKLAFKVFRKFGMRKGYDGLAPEIKQNLAHLYSEEIEKLAALTGLDFSIWDIPPIKKAQAANG